MTNENSQESVPIWDTHNRTGRAPFKRSSNRTKSPQIGPPHVNALNAPGFPSSESLVTSMFLKRRGMILPKRMLPEIKPATI